MISADEGVARHLAATSADAMSVASQAVLHFFEADLRSATRRFLKYAHGAFGLVARTSFAPCEVVIGSVKQPMIVGLGPGLAVYASERAAVHVGECGARLTHRRVLSEGEVVWRFAGHAADCLAFTAQIDDAEPFRELLSPEDWDGVQGNELMMSQIPLSRFEGDVVGKDIAETPSLLRAVRDTFRDSTSFNSRTARAFARALFVDVDAVRKLDLIIVGTESSLWLGEQWATNMRSAFPRLRVVVTSANKALATLTACAVSNDRGATTPGHTVFPSGFTPAWAGRKAVVLAISHSGQTFPTLNAASALRDAGAIVFAAAGQLDTVIATDVLEQRFGKDSPFCEHIFSTKTGLRAPRLFFLSFRRRRRTYDGDE